jgi:glycosyltransferase involved in cell wall biosynthesis
MILEKGCIIIPAFNEQKNIAEVVGSAAKILPTLVIDDGSQDNTASIAKDNGAITFLQNPNQGKGAALKRGFSEAIQLGFDYGITVDADGQHDISEIPEFQSLNDSDHFDLIIGYRDFSKMPISRRIANTLGGLAFSWAMGMKILDNQSGYRLMSKRMMQVVLNSEEAGFEFEVDVIVICIQNGFSLGWIPIKTIYGDEKSHIQPLKHIQNFFRVILQTRKRMRNK